MSETRTAYAIGYCSTCADKEKAERLITTNESQWMMAAMACRECASYQVKIEITP